MSGIWDDNYSIETVLRRSTRRALPVAMSRGMNNRAVSDALQTLIGRLGRFYAIERASLALYDAEKDNLRLSYMYQHGKVHTGLTLILKKDQSLLHQVLMQGFPIVDNYPEQITGCLIEKKTLVTPTTQSVLVVPLVVEGIRLGLVNLSSAIEGAFGLYLEGVGQAMVEEFVTELFGLLSGVTDGSDAVSDRF